MDALYDLQKHLALDDVTEDYVATIELFNDHSLGQLLLSCGLVIQKHSFDLVAEAEQRLVLKSGPELSDADQERLLYPLLTKYHEWDHYRMYISTPVGIYWTRLEWMRIGEALRMLRKVSRLPTIYLPLAKWAERCSEANAASYLSQLVTGWRLISALETILFGETELPWAGGMRLWNALVKFSPLIPGGLLYESDYSAPFVLPVLESQDQIATEYHVGAIHLFEAHARLYEMELTGRIWRNRRISSDLVFGAMERRHFGIYRRAFDVAETILGERYFVMARLLSFAIDLALLAPLEPRLSHFCVDRKLTWKDIHPGWRYVRILKTIGGLGLRQVEGASYEDFVKLICSSLQLPHPQEYIGLLMGDQYQGETWLFRYTEQMQRKAMNVRLAMPGCFCDYNAYSGGLLAMQDLEMPCSFMDEQLVFHRIKEGEFSEFFLALVSHILIQEMVCNPDLLVTKHLVFSVAKLMGLDAFEANKQATELFDTLITQIAGTSLDRLKPLEASSVDSNPFMLGKLAKYYWIESRDKWFKIK